MAWPGPLRGLALALLFGLALAGSAQEARRTFLVRTPGGSVAAVSDRFAEALQARLQGPGPRAKGYPEAGHLVEVQDPQDPKARLLLCEPGAPAGAGAVRCLRLDGRGAFLRVQPVTWPSAAFFMFRIYVLPEGAGRRVDPARDFVAVDVYTGQDGALREAVWAAVRSAAADVGAEPYSP